MKKVIAWLLVLALTATVSIGATLAYLTDTDEDVNVMTLGKVKIDQLEFERVDDETKDKDAVVQEFHDNKPLYPAIIDKDFDWAPGDTYVDWEQIGKDGYTSDIWDPSKINNEVDKMVFVKNKGDYDAYVRSVIAFEAGAYETLDEYLSMVHLNLNQNEDVISWEWVETPVEIGEGTYFVAVATYKDALKPGELTEISLSQIALDPSATNEDVKAFGDTFQVLVKSQAIQAEGFPDADTALNEGFGEITADNIPWENDSPIRGIDLRTALHNLNGDTTKNITARISNVIYALNEEYPEIVDGYEGTLVDIEQDVPVYAYYVPNGSNYDVYFLADDTIYSPKDSSKLYMNMTALETVDTHNYDVSRVDNMLGMFTFCRELETIDLTHWDTSNVTTMRSMFWECDSLTELDMADWNVEKVENLRTFIYGCDSLKKLDISGWNVTSPCEAGWMAARNPALEEIDATGMQTNGITFGCAMFQLNTSLKTLTGEENWEFSNATDTGWMFEGCSSLPEITVDGWDLSKATTTQGMFSGCSSMATIEGSETWKLDSVQDMSYMFQSCISLEYIDVTGWNMENCVNMDRTFFDCQTMETVEGSETWNMGNVENMFATFYNNKSLTDLDVSTWNTGSVANFDSCFRGDVALEYLDVSNWDVSKVATFRSMFSSFKGNAGDMGLKEFDMSKWYAPEVTDIAYMFYGCAQLKELDFSSWCATKITNMGHTFSDCYGLEKLDFSGWKTSELTVLDATFNNCNVIKQIDMSMFDTSSVKEFTQTFEYCAKLEKIIGLENWDTSSGAGFDEMFSHCESLKELDLSSFDTGNAQAGYKQHNNSYSNGFGLMFNCMYSLEKLTLGEKFSFVGNGTVTADNQVKLPAPGYIEGSDGKWYNAATGIGYLPSEIPAQTAATYVAVYTSASDGGTQK